MKIKNETVYDTRVLKTIFCKTYQKLAKYEGPLQQWKHMKVYVGYSRTWYNRGRAILNGYRIEINLVRPKDYPNGRWVGTNSIDCSYIFWHELFHSYGYRHKQMARGDNFPKDWAEKTFTDAKKRVPLKKPKPKKPKPDTQVLRYQRVLRRQKEWTTRLRRAQTTLKTLAKKRGYYEKVLTEKGFLKPSSSEE